MPAAMAVAAGIVADRFAEPCGTLTWVAAAVVAAFAGASSARLGRWAGPLALFVAVAALAGARHHRCWSDLSDDHLARAVDDAPAPAWVRGVLVEVNGFRPGPSPDDDGATRAVIELTGVQSDGAWQEVSGLAALTVAGDRSDLRPGMLVEAAGAVSAEPGPLNPGEFDYRAYLRAEGVRLRLSVDNPEGVWPASLPDAPGLAWLWPRALGAVRAWSQAKLTARLDPASAPLASALLLGRREAVSPEVNDAFARTGTTHLLAISGLHLQVLAYAVGIFLRLLGVPRRPAIVLVGAATVAYALLVGLMPSVVRSAAMTVAYCACALFDRQHRPGNILALAALVTLGLNPSDLFDVGCQLSFLAVAVIAWGVEPVWRRVDPEPDPLTGLERRFATGRRRWARIAWLWLAEGLTVSTVVWLVAVPLVALRFHLVSPIGVLLNVPLIPLTSLALLAAGVCLGLSAVWEPLGAPAGWVCSTLLGWTDALVRWGASLRWGHAFEPGAPWWWVLAFYALLALATCAARGLCPGRRASRAALLGWVPLGLALAGWPAPWPFLRGAERFEAEVLAVGHGLAVVLDAGPGGAWLYDCGRLRDPSVGRRIVAPALWSRGLRRLDAVVLSHADADHYNGLPDVLDRFSVGEVLVPPDFGGGGDPAVAALLGSIRARGVPVRTAALGSRFRLGPAEIVARHPPADWSAKIAPDNARSLVLEVSSLGRSLWLTGDLDGEGLSALTALPSPSPGSVDVFLSPHHGGRTANPAWLYDWASPAQVVVSQREPQPGTRDPLAALEDSGSVSVLRTWRRGAVRLRWEPSGVKATGFRDGAKTLGRPEP
ncbi:MAG: ComEC/Rec2 family competence protein [Isosphaeraceae bacterium]